MPATILLTLDDVRRWRAERDALAAQVAVLDKKLAAANLFMNEPVQAAAGAGETGLSLNDRIEQVVRASSRPLSPKQIRDAVSKGAGVAMGSENYLYTAIKRLADRGKITKTDQGYVPVVSSSQEEAGETASPPGSTINQERPFQGATPEGGAVSAAPEAGGT